MEKIIEVKNLVKRFSEITAVNDISFQVEKGELFGFLGVNGAGKSTTINILCTLLGATEGTVEICGYDLKTQGEEIRKKIGVVFQENTLDDRLTIRENLILRGSLYEKDSKKIKQNIQMVTEILEIGDLLNRQFRKLSGGQKRRCELAKSLMNTPELLFLDEPTTGLDPHTRQQVWKSVERLRAEMNMTVFLTTHYMEEAAMSQHICVMDAGKIVTRGTPAELKERYTKDVLKLYSKAPELLENYLNEQKISYEVKTNHIVVPVNSTMDSLGILNNITDKVYAFEVAQGNMDDAFINITGKKLEA